MQHLSKKNLGWRLKTEAFPGSVVVGGNVCAEEDVVDGVEVCLARQGSSQAADGVFDGAFLPGTVGIAEEGPDCELVGEDEVLSELGAIVQGDGFAQPAIERPKPGRELADSRLEALLGCFASRTTRDLRSSPTRMA